MNDSKLISKAGYLLILFVMSVPSFAGAPKVVVSIAPIHSLVSQVMLGVAQPLLLIEGGQSPHSHNLKPSAVRKIAEADLIIRIGPNFEFALEKPIASKRRSVQLMDLIASPKMHLLAHRGGQFWQAESETELPHASAEHDGEHDDWLVDPHLWLSSDNAKLIIEAVQLKLAKLDPDNAQRYQANSEQAISNIDILTTELKKKLAPVRTQAYMVFHDAYQYFEAQFDLNAVAAVTLRPQSSPGAKTLMEIEQTINQQKINCLFHEPQFQARLVQRIVQASKLKSAELDPMGAALTPGPELWPTLMTNLSHNLVACLAGS